MKGNFKISNVPETISNMVKGVLENVTLCYVRIGYLSKLAPMSVTTLPKVEIQSNVL